MRNAATELKLSASPPTRGFEIKPGLTANLNVTLWGDLGLGWLGRLCSALARRGISIQTAQAVRRPDDSWRGTLELDPDLKPRAVVLRLSKVPEKLPEGFEKLAGRSAVGTAVEGFGRLRASALAALREKVPAGAKAGAPYVRWALDPPEPTQVLLLLAWTAAK